MKLSSNLESILEGIHACTRCHVCTYGPWPKNYPFCPIYERGRTFTTSAGGLLYCAKAILSKRMDYNQSLADLAYTCVACGACDKCLVIRPSNPLMTLSDMLRLIRYELVKRDFVPEGIIKKMNEEVKNKGDFIGNGRTGTLKILDKVVNDKARMVLMADGTRTDTEALSFDAALGLLKKMNREMALFSDPGTFGATLYDFGFWDQLPALVEEKWKRVKSLGKQSFLFLELRHKTWVCRVELIEIPRAPHKLGIDDEDVGSQAFHRLHVKASGDPEVPLRGEDEGVFWK